MLRTIFMVLERFIYNTLSFFNNQSKLVEECGGSNLPRNVAGYERLLWSCSIILRRQHLAKNRLLLIGMCSHDRVRWIADEID